MYFQCINTGQRRQMIIACFQRCNYVLLGQTDEDGNAAVSGYSSVEKMLPHHHVTSTVTQHDQ